MQAMLVVMVLPMSMALLLLLPTVVMVVVAALAVGNMVSAAAAVVFVLPVLRVTLMVVVKCMGHSAVVVATVCMDMVQMLFGMMSAVVCTVL